MDTIIYVIYRQIQANEHRTGNSLTDSIRVQPFSLGKDFRILQLTVCETQVEGNRENRGILRQLATLFPEFRARRLRKERADLTEQIQSRLFPYLDQWGENVCIYAGLPHGKGENGNGAWLREALGVPEFEGYSEWKWIDRVLPYAKWERFLALGTVGCVRQVFERIAPRAKSLLWIVPDFTYKAQVETVAEMLYEEYGLAVDLRFLPEGAVFSRLQISGTYLAEPMNVLDFTGEKYVPPLTLVPDSAWLDIGAVAEKERRIKGRRMPVEYISLRSLAEHPAADFFRENRDGY